MTRYRFINKLSGLGFAVALLIGTMIADANEAEIIAELKRGNATRYIQHRDSFKSHAFFPYYEYLALKLELETLSPHQVQAYLTAFPKSHYAMKLQQAYLNQLAKRQDWNGYLNFYADDLGSRYDCQYATALIGQEQYKQANALIAKLWLSGESQPEQCNLIFSYGEQTGIINDDMRWQRAALAMQKNNFSLANYLAKQISPEAIESIKRWQGLVRRPQQVTRIKWRDHAHDRAVVTDLILRLSDKQPELASRLWKRYKKALAFNAAQKADVHRSIALALALKAHPESTYWLNLTSYDPNDSVLNEWRVRASLAQEDWHGVHQAIQLLGPDDQHKPCWKYWQGRAYHALGHAEKAHELFQDVAQQRHFYGFLASTHLARPAQLNHKEQDIPEADYQAIANHPLISQTQQYYLSNRHHQARFAWRRAMREFNQYEQYIAAKIAKDWGWHEQAIFTMKKNDFRNDIPLRFPIVFKDEIIKHAEKNNIHPAFIYALIRQESSFMRDAVSPDGARGLMQLLPKTAKDYATKHESKTIHSNLLNEKTNIRLGSAHLKRMLKEYDGRYVAVAAAYNAGGRQVNKWLKTKGHLEPAIWVETIPWYETRNYLKNVLTYFVIYQHQLGNKTNIKEIMRDI